jgi:hypothetical protein
MRVVWNQYPQARIPREFRQATGDHLNAIKAELCLLDHDLANLAKSNSALIGSRMEIYAAGAAYNGGPGRVRHGLERFGLAWLQPASRLAELGSRTTLTRSEKLELRWLRRYRHHETFVYLNKIHAIRRAQNKLSESAALSNETSVVDGKPLRNELAPREGSLVSP